MNKYILAKPQQLNKKVKENKNKLYSAINARKNKLLLFYY